MSAGPEIERLIQLLSKLPGLGPRSARRASLSLLQKREQLMMPLADALAEAAVERSLCQTRQGGRFSGARSLQDP